MTKFKKAFLLDVILGAVVALGVISLQWSADRPVWHKLCDGFFVAAVLLLATGGLRAVSKTGFFDAMGYALKTGIQNFLPMSGTNPLRAEEDLFTYKQRKAKSRKSAADLLLAGAVYLILSLIALALYNTV